MVNEEKIKIFSEKELSIRNEGLVLINAGMNHLGIPFFLMMGVLLGAVREKDFIKWDWDVELGLFTDSIINRVEDIQRYFENKSFLFELVDSSYEGFKINLFYKNNKYTLWGMHYKGKYLKRTSYKFPKKHFSSFDSLIFRGKMYNIPNNVEELLMVIYGDWKIPKKTSVKEDYLEKQIVIKKTVLNRIIKRVAKLTKKYWT